MYGGSGEPRVQGLGCDQAPQKLVGYVSMFLKGTPTARPSEDVLDSTGPLGVGDGTRVLTQ